MKRMNIAFVCTGNTCRSPMAEAIFREKTKNFADACNVLSCGISAFPGDAASENAVKVMAKRGIDISSHRARQINSYIIDEADFIICLSFSHYGALRSIAQDKLLLLGDGISDPFGGSEEAYSLCADEIEKAVEALLESDVFYETAKTQARDIQFISEIEKECFSEPWSENAFKSQITKSYGVNFVVRYLGKAVGYVCADNVANEVYIGNIAVREDMRRRHIADRLLGALISYCEENKSELLTLEVRKSNIPALNLYGKYGFNVVGTRKDFYKEPTEDAYIMTKYFNGDNQ